MANLGIIGAKTQLAYEKIEAELEAINQRIGTAVPAPDRTDHRDRHNSLAFLEYVADSLQAIRERVDALGPAPDTKAVEANNGG